MSSPASVGRRDRLRLFLALPLPEETIDRLVAWQRATFHARTGARLVPRENMHVTLAFLGSRPAEDVRPIVAVVHEVAGRLAPPVLRAAGYRETPRVGMVVLEDEDGRAGLLAERLGEGLERLGVYERERRRWLAHVTVLRFGPGVRLREKAAPPELGQVSPSEVALYHSVLRPGGAQYEIRESVALGG